MRKKEKRDAVLNLRVPKRVKRNIISAAQKQMKTMADVANERLDIAEDKEDYE